MKKIFVSGGAGYIGSHFVIKLLEQGYEPFIYDDFSNSSTKVFERIKKITHQDVSWVSGDIRHKKKLSGVFADNEFFAVVHFAGKKSVKESQDAPLDYYSVNVTGSVCLLEVMDRFNVKNLIFSSTATVYGDRNDVALPESSLLNPINNYGKSKRMVEIILESLASSNPKWNFCVLRYFNPVGAHPSGLIGEDPKGLPANLMPFISQVAIGRRDKLFIYGKDYPTRDGTGARDYIHVEDLAEAHISALKYLENSHGYEVFNIGTGKNVTVKEMVKTFSSVNHVNIPFEEVERRPGDTAICYADPGKAKKILKWSSKLTLEDMCRDTWNWQKQNPTGY